jgi:hypothetical protein
LGFVWSRIGSCLPQISPLPSSSCVKMCTTQVV